MLCLQYLGEQVSLLLVAESGEVGLKC